MPELGNVSIFVCCDHVIAEQGTGKQSVVRARAWRDYDFVDQYPLLLGLASGGTWSSQLLD